FIAGDCSGVEEASSAMMEGRIAGLSAAKQIGLDEGFNEKLRKNEEELERLRGGEVASEVRAGLREVRI
ncbi:MAG: hypothetical protein ACLFVS_07325, partial [Candidatus Acetothermia bacterium]